MASGRGNGIAGLDLSVCRASIRIAVVRDAKEGALIPVQPNVIAENRHAPRWNPTIKVVVGVILFVVVVVALYSFRIVFVPLIIGGIMAYILNPVARWIQRVTRLPRGISTALIYLTLLAVLIPIGIALVPVVVDAVKYLQGEAMRLLDSLNNLPDQTLHVGGFSFDVQQVVDEVTSALMSLIRSAASQSIRLVFNAAEILLLVIFTFLIGFYLTRDAEKFIATVQGVIPPDYRPDAEDLLAEIDKIWSAFFRGQMMLSAIVAVILTVVSAVLGLPQPVLMGVLGGLLEFLPSVGHAIWLITASIIAVLEGSTYLPVSNLVFMLLVMGAHVAFTQFDLNYLIPRIIGGHVHLHPMVVIIGIIIGASVGGVLGIVLAAPTIASLRVIARYIYAKLFDLDPFPMVGPPVAPKEERQAQAERLAAVPPPPSPHMVIERVRQRRPRRAKNASGNKTATREGNE
jgi:predicted PurR-regulated permease PerM